ncbi:XRE family transcriptional regulator [Mucilaginibacter limnophilus]|uniref:XRE family transcriptional regulator n=1 Tax=Mucilaginibacter limnophilus TaxID=1932778 RepID=A0A437MLK6_9SPHI|nr:helix-turn-helix transcriptional regulator [Mucilaginibacter limnophilus]RVT98476.1 XRE family transcriptional regulator [Mucilaginibacter limnophilus]
MSATRDENTLTAFGKNLQRIRKEKKVSLRKLEILAEVDHSEIHRIEKGKRNPSLTVMLALAKGLNIDPKDLFNF